MALTWSDHGITVPSSSTGEIDTPCPACSASRKKKSAKCLSVNIEKGTWLCHHCAWRGSLASGVDGQSDPWTWKSKTYTKPAYPIGLPMTDPIEAWFDKRGIASDVIAQHHISPGCVYMPQTEQFENVIQFPYFRDGELINVKYRMLEAKEFRMVGGAERLLYNLDAVKEAEAVLICEGECDVLSLANCGIPAISVPDGGRPHSQCPSWKCHRSDEDANQWSI
jgi:twinkle protein